MRNFYDFLIMTAAEMAALAQNPFYDTKKGSHFDGRNIKVKKTPDPDLHVYSIHGEKITARNRKTAIKIYNLKHNK